MLSKQVVDDDGKPTATGALPARDRFRQTRRRGTEREFPHGHLRLGCHRLGTGGPEGGHRRLEARLSRRDRGPREHDGRGLHQHRHHPVEDAAGSRVVPDRLEPARAVRAGLPGQAGHHHLRRVVPDRARGQPGDRRHPQSARPQPRGDAGRHREVRRRPHDQRHHGSGHQHTDRRRQVRHRGRHQAGPAGNRRIRRRDDRGFRPDPGDGQGSVLDGGGRRRGDRHRVRIDVCRAGHQGHRGGGPPEHAGLLRRRDRRRSALPVARSGGDLPVLRDGAVRGEASGRHPDHPRIGQEDPRRHRAVLRRPAGRHR